VTAATALRAALALAALLSASPALAGPPYLTDDPEPTDTGHWEVYGFANGMKSGDGLGGETGLDINYGGAKDLQLTAVLPLGYSADGYSLDHLTVGTGVIELAAKLKLLHQSEHSWVPDLAVFPRIFVPTDARFGPAKANLWLPVWLGKDFGPWSVFGGGGYQINPGQGEKGFWQGGIALTRSFGEKASLGAEVWRQTDDSPGSGGFIAANIGATWRLTKHWSLIGSAGPTWQDHGGHGSDVYVALKLDD
jgi:hypothetical protein